MADEKTCGCNCSNCDCGSGPGGGGRCRRGGALVFALGFLLGILMTVGGFGLFFLGRHAGGHCRMRGPMMPGPWARPAAAPRPE